MNASFSEARTFRFADYNDNEIALIAYSIETVIAEKFQTIIDRGFNNSRMKDFYDLYTILKRENYDQSTLNEALLNTFTARNTQLDGNNNFFEDSFGEDENLRMRWQSFVRKLKLDSPADFSEVVSYIKGIIIAYI